MLLEDVVGAIEIEYYFYDPNDNLVDIHTETRDYVSVADRNIMGETNAFRGTHELGQWRVEYYIDGSYYATDYFSVDVHLTFTPNFVLDDVGATIASLSWDESANAWSYLLYRDGALIAETKNLYFTDTGLDPSTEYLYTILPKAGSKVSSFDREVTATTIAQPFDSAVSYIAENWTHGSDDAGSSEYWNLQPVNPRKTFSEWTQACSLSTIANISADHRWKTEFFKDGQSHFIDETSWLYVGSGWDFSSTKPIISNLSNGSYEVVNWIDIGHGYEFFSRDYFTVDDMSGDYVFAGVYAGENWTYGATNSSDPSYWDLQIVNRSETFDEGDRVYILAQAENVSVDHEWKIEFYRDGVFQWDTSSGRHIVSGTWGYSNFYPYADNASAGLYEARVFMQTDADFEYLESVFYLFRK